MADFVEDGERVGVGGVVDHAYTTHFHHIVDILDIGGHLIVGFLQFPQVFLLAVVGVGHLSDIAACAIDTQQMVLLVIDGNEL